MEDQLKLIDAYTTDNGEVAPKPGVFVHTEPVEGGKAVAIEAIGGLDPLAVPSLLELALKVARANLGLPTTGGQ